jgi:hypothetical protein
VTEAAFMRHVHSKLDPAVYVEKTSNPYRAGMPDMYIEGPKNILWVEYKWLPTLWTADRTCDAICRTKSWVAQLRWLRRAHHNGVKAAVVIGIGKGRSAAAYIILWPYHFSVTKDLPVTVQQLRTWILEQTT